MIGRIMYGLSGLEVKQGKTEAVTPVRSGCEQSYPKPKYRPAPYRPTAHQAVTMAIRET